MQSKLDQLRALLAEISDLGGARALLNWDEWTKMPPGGAEARGEQQATLARIGHERLVSDELGRLVDEAAAQTDGLPYESDEASLVRVARRDWEKARRVPAELRAEITRTSSVAEHAWVKAKERSDYAAYLPYLERNVELKRRYAECFEGFDGFEHVYDPLLDDFEPGMTTAEVGAVLEELRDGIRPLMADIANRGDAVDDTCLHGHFPLDDQAELAREVVAALPLEDGAWRLDPTVHPFATAISPSDIRITTRYDESYIGTALWAVIHEAGHGLYENGVARELERSPLCSPVSLGFHESQSRMWENLVGRSRAFWTFAYDDLREALPDELGDVDRERFYRAVNRIRPSLTRVDADEITYNLHIVLRFELERELLAGRLEVRDLPEAFDERMLGYLGLEIPDARSGVLQDIHWADATFGYFPTYTLGNVMSVQIWEKACSDLGDLDAHIERGELGGLRDWLREHLHRHGRKFTPRETLLRAAGSAIDPEPYVRYLKGKLGEVAGVAVS